MAAGLVRRFEEPDVGRAFDHGRIDVVEVGGIAMGRETLLPGWRWSTHLKPVVGTEHCQMHHLGICLSGHLRLEMADGTSFDVRVGDVYDIPPGHDGWVVGDDPVVLFDVSPSVAAFATHTVAERFLVTLLFTDIVGSTRTAEGLGDVAWQAVVALHDRLVRQEIDRFRGREIRRTGDGFLVTFDGAARAVRCAMAIRTAVGTLGLLVRIGVHTGEVELTAGQLQGLALHAAARVMELAEPDEVLMSSTTRDLLAGSGIDGTPKGAYDLRGLTGPRMLYAVRP